MQGDSLGWTTVILQAVRVQFGVGVLQTGLVGEAAVGAALQIELLDIERTPTRVGAVATTVVSHDGPVDVGRAAGDGEATARRRCVGSNGAVRDGHHGRIPDEEAAATFQRGGIQCRVIFDGAVVDGHCACVDDDATPCTPRVVGKGAIRDGDRAVEANETTTHSSGVICIVDESATADRQRARVTDSTPLKSRVVGEGAIADGHRAAFVLEPATPGGLSIVTIRAVSNGEVLEGKADTANVEHFHLVLPIQGDLLAVPIQCQIFGDLERAGEKDRATATKFDDGAARRGGDGAAQICLSTGADGDGGGGARST